MRGPSRKRRPALGFDALVFVLSSVVGLVHCGGTVHSGAGVGDGFGSGSGSGGGSDSRRGGGSGNGSGRGGGSGSGVRGGDTGTSPDGGPSGTEAGADGSTGPEPPRTTALLAELAALHMDQPLAALVDDPCPTTLSLGWDLDRDGTTDASETRIFDGAGRLVVAEITGSRDAGDPVRKRIRIHYDGSGRPAQYLYAVDGAGSFPPFVGLCSGLPQGLPRGTVVDVDYETDGSATVRTVSTEICGAAICETLSFDAGGRFLRRHRGCVDSSPGFEFDQRRELDGQGRPRMDSLVGGYLWGSQIRYEYPSIDAVVVSWNEGDVGSACTECPLRTLTTRLDGSDRPARREFRSDPNGSADEVVSFEYGADGCGVIESTDFWNDGVNDIVTTTSCENGRMAHMEERNMTSVHDVSTGGALEYRQVTPLFATPQSDVTIDVTSEGAGRITYRAFGVSTVQNLFDYARSERQTFHYATTESTGELDRTVPDQWSQNPYPIGSESSSTTCRIDNACASVPAIDPALALCDLGIGVSVVPDLYRRVPGVSALDLDWAPFSLDRLRVPRVSAPAGFVQSVPGMRAIIGY